MSSRPSLSLDGRILRDDESPVARRSFDRRLARTAAADGIQSPVEMQAGVVHQEIGPTSPSSAAPRRHLVFPDPIALKYLEEDQRAEVVQRQAVLHGYELYLIEQWACSRKSPTLVIATYTGDERHSIFVGVLAVPADEKLWSNRLRVYLKAADQTHTRPKETELGELMITNLSSFPSSLTAIPVPNGDLRSHRHIFIVNEDLKRLGCSGRSGLTLTDPTEATQSKFQQIYKTNKDIPFSRSVTELIKLCQVALYMFQKLDHEYIDGLLCDATETAIRNWWADVGGEHYNYESTDGVLGPSTVAALLGLFMGARNRLHWQGAPVSKDVFDIESTKRGIASFQKGQKLDRTRRLDQQTLFKLITVTTKAAAKEGWGVQKAVKSTMTEIGGKRGEIVMDMVSGKDKGGLADIETVDIDRFVSLVYGERPKWLWYGKPRRTLPEDRGHDLDSDIGQSVRRIHSLPTDDEAENRLKEELTPVDSGSPLRSTTNVSDSHAEKDPLRKTVLKSVAEKMSDARSGLGRIKDAVGARGRGHGSRSSIATKEEALEGSNGAQLSRSPSNNNNAFSPTIMTKTFAWKNKPEEYLAGMKRGDPDVLPGLTEESSYIPSSTVSLKTGRTYFEDEQRSRDPEPELEGTSLEVGNYLQRQVPSAAPSANREAFDDVAYHDTRPKSGIRHLTLLRRHSFDASELTMKHVPNENRWARRMSFSDAEPAILTWEEIVGADEVANSYADADTQAIAARLNRYMASIIHDIEPWVNEKIDMVKLLNDQYGRDKAELQNLYYHLSEACQRVQYNSEEILAEGRATLTENIKEIEVLVARLDYEMNSLVAKVQDVEDGIHNFERQVQEVERRADELKSQLESESWLHWFVRTLTGVGTGPNITRSVP